jgi:hypothetical protein
MPFLAGLAPALGPQALREQRGEARLPLPDGLLCEGKAAREEHLGQVAQAQLVAESPEDDEERDVGGDLQMVEGRARALIEGALAGPAPEQAIAQGRHAVQFLCRISLTVRTAHHSLLSASL